jgi:hypothetical protein
MYSMSRSRRSLAHIPSTLKALLAPGDAFLDQVELVAADLFGAEMLGGAAEVAGEAADVLGA